MAIKVTGIVSGGKRLGRELGFPTANITLDNDTQITDGVYAARTTINGRTYDGMANVGRRKIPSGVPQNPNVKPGTPLLEINIFGFDGDIYGERIDVELLEYIRGERSFASVEELKQTVETDRRTIQEYFKTHR